MQFKGVSDIKGLKIIRERLGISQKKMGDITGIDPNTLSRYERGRLTPSSAAVLQISNALHVTADELLNGPKEGKIEINLIFGEMSEKGEIDMSENGNKFDLFMDKNGTLGIRGGAKFKSLEDIAQFVADIGEELKKGFEFQQSRGAIAGAD